MASEILTIRLPRGARAELEADAKRLGLGISEYLRKLAEAKALELECARIRRQGEEFLRRLKSDPKAYAAFVGIAEIGVRGGVWDNLDWGGPLPEAWRKAAEEFD